MGDAFDTAALVADILPDGTSEKVIRMPSRVWEVFIGGLIGLKMPGVTGEAFYRLPHVDEAVAAVRNAEDA